LKDILHRLNKVFENRVRLGIMSLLMVHESLDFNSLKETLQVSDGNLASHIATLEKNDFVDIEKSFVGKKPLTTYAATAAGRKAFEDHLNALEMIIKGIE
jgi:DNA-binding MarR family transcriptional regulator